MDYGFVGGWCIDWTVARLCAGNAAGIAEIEAIAGWACHVSKVRGKETAGSKNKDSKNRQFFEGIRKYRIYISLRGRRNVWTGK